MKILFQGDSITDAGRDRSDPHELGTGYPLYAAKYIRSEHPDTDFEFIDLGISGDQTINLVARLQADFIDIQPDLVSIHIGINDTWHRAETREWLDNETFEANYRKVLTEIKEKQTQRYSSSSNSCFPFPIKNSSARISTVRSTPPAALQGNSPTATSRSTV